MLYTRFRIHFILIIISFSISLFVQAQKKPLDHSVYDAWQSIGERKLNADGSWIVYTVDLQEGDGKLVLQKTNSTLV